jgi:DNA-binding CsgD family transcriptional regulator/PAS domain-containing protein
VRSDCSDWRTDPLGLLIRELYAAAADPTQWGRFLERLARGTGSETAVLLVHDLAEGDGAALQCFGFGPDAAGEYLQWAPRNVYIQAAAPLMDCGVVIRNVPLERRQILESAFHRDFLSRHARVCDAAAACIAREKDVFAFVAVNRALRAPDYGPEEESLLRHLVPHLQRAVEIHRRFAEIDLQRAATAEIIDRMRTAVFFVGDDRRVLFYNAAAGRILARADGLSLARDGQLTATGRAGGRELERSVFDACLTGTGRGTSSGASFRLERVGTEKPYNVVVSPLALPEAPFVGRRPAAVVMVGDPDHPAPAQDQLAEMFGLTPAQAALTGLLATGDSLDNAAEQLRISRNTARWTLKQVFFRTSTSRQSELVKLVESSPVWAASRNTGGTDERSGEN